MLNYVTIPCPHLICLLRVINSLLWYSFPRKKVVKSFVVFVDCSVEICYYPVSLSSLVN